MSLHLAPVQSTLSLVENGPACVDIRPRCRENCVYFRVLERCARLGFSVLARERIERNVECRVGPLRPVSQQPHEQLLQAGPNCIPVGFCRDISIKPHNESLHHLTVNLTHRGDIGTITVKEQEPHARTSECPRPGGRHACGMMLPERKCQLCSQDRPRCINGKVKALGKFTPFVEKVDRKRSRRTNQGRRSCCHTIIFVVPHHHQISAA
jgi:hypothetical protein